MPYFPNQNVPGTQTTTDRRRRERAETDNPHLIALFRTTTTTEAIPLAEIADQIASHPHIKIDEHEIDEHDPRAIARGIAFALLGGIALWAAIVFCARHFL